MLIHQTRVRPQETLEYEPNQQLEKTSFSPPINLVEERKWLIAVTSFEATNSVFKITDEINSFQLVHPVVGGFPTFYPLELLISLKYIRASISKRY